MGAMGATFVTPGWVGHSLGTADMPKYLLPGLRNFFIFLFFLFFFFNKKKRQLIQAVVRWRPWQGLHGCPIVAAQETGPYSTELATLWDQHVFSSLRTFFAWDTYFHRHSFELLIANTVGFPMQFRIFWTVVLTYELSWISNLCDSEWFQELCMITI